MPLIRAPFERPSSLRDYAYRELRDDPAAPDTPAAQHPSPTETEGRP